MSDDDDDSPPDEVGYKRPPKHSRVVKGQVLNPKGRPVGSKNKPKEESSSKLRAMLLKEARREVTINDAKGPVTLTMFEMAVRKLGLQGGKGSVRALHHFVALTRQAEREEAEERSKMLIDIGEYLVECERQKRDFAARGKKPPAHLMDPDGIIFGPEGLLGYRPAMTGEDKNRWEKQRADLQGELKAVRAELEGAKGRQRTRLRDEIGVTEGTLKVFADALAGSRHAMWVLDQGTLLFEAGQDDEEHESGDD